MEGSIEMDEEFDELYRTVREGINFTSGILNKQRSAHSASAVQPTAIQAAINPSETPFVFTGQFTDLCYFERNEVLAHATINNLDEELKSAVKDNFEKASKDGLVKIDNKNMYISLTDKGKKYISNPSFIEAARKEQAHAVLRMQEALSTTAVKATTATAVQAAAPVLDIAAKAAKGAFSL